MEMMISSQFGTILSSVLVLSIMFPLQFKFGAEKSRVALIAVIGSIFFIVTVGVKIIEKLNVELSWLNVLWNNDYLLLGVLAFIVILFIIFSIKMSMKIMLKKEL
ncbi:MAG: ABC-2 transporter permease [Erysipelotrichaceae bacterium]|nr:ABC-2 transporter permease [Erysipelotrichaceae bacterium]